ncbi:hypothetical protein IVA87_33835 [Bradyrhizobium sp. 147]|nr:hypothetical protein [Bradyrhizobium sp. 147]
MFRPDGSIAEVGDIVSFGSGSDYGDGFETSLYPGCQVAIVDDQPIDPRRQRFDAVAWKVVAKDAPDASADRVDEVRAAVRAELAASDKYVMPDYPIAEDDRAAWVAYRKALRDASKGNVTAAAMLAAIPARPDGSRLTLNLET